MTTRPSPPFADQEAINRLLAAQHQAELAIATCREQAAGILVAARNQTIAVTQKADQRISTIHKERARKIKKRVQLLLQQNALEENRENAELLRLQQAVTRLAAELSGGEP